jgi:hypothetical protein
MKWSHQQPIGCPVERNVERIAMASSDNARIGDTIQGTRAGDRISHLSLKLQGTGAPQTVEVYVAKEGPSGRTVIARLDVYDPPATWETHEFALPAPCAVLEGESLSVVACLPLAGTCIGAIGHATLDASEGVAL